MTLCKQKNWQSFGKRLVWTGSWRAPVFGCGVLPGASNCSCVASTLHASTRQISGTKSVVKTSIHLASAKNVAQFFSHVFFSESYRLSKTFKPQRKTTSEESWMCARCCANPSGPSGQQGYVDLRRWIAEGTRFKRRPGSSEWMVVEGLKKIFKIGWPQDYRLNLCKVLVFSIYNL